METQFSSEISSRLVLLKMHPINETQFFVFFYDNSYSAKMCLFGWPN